MNCIRLDVSQYCKCKSPKVKLPKISRVQKVDKTAILQVQKSKGQTSPNISVQKVDKTAILQVQKSKGQTSPNISVQKVDKTAILQAQKSKGQTTQNIKSAKGRKPGALALLIFWVV